MPTWHGPLEAEVKLFVCPSYVEGVSVLKNPFAPISAPGSEAKYASFVVFWPCLWPHLDRRPGQQRLFQHAVDFSHLSQTGWIAHRPSAQREAISRWLHTPLSDVGDEARRAALRKGLLRGF